MLTFDLVLRSAKGNEEYDNLVVIYKQETYQLNNQQLWIIWWIALFVLTMEPSFDKVFLVLLWTVKTSLTIRDQQESNWQSFW